MKPDEPVPAGVDYDMWLGPAPKRPFNRNRFHFTFRWFWDYAGGLMTDWGVHLLDYALFGMNVTTPDSIMASGGKFGYPDDACETPDLLQTIYTFKDFTVMWDHAIGIDDGAYGRNHGLGFVGENGTEPTCEEPFSVHQDSEPELQCQRRDWRTHCQVLAVR